MADTTGQGAGEQAGQGSGAAQKARPGQRRVAQWTRDYVRLQGIPDEYIAQDGTPRAVWTRFFDACAALTPAEIERILKVCGPHALLAGGQALAAWPVNYDVQPIGELSLA